MSSFRALDISSSALSAERLRLEVHLTNLANAHTTRTAEGGPYRRREVVFEAASEFDHAVAGVRARIVEDDAPARKIYDPGHPDADPDGYLAVPAVDPVLEQADIVSAARGYEANLAVLRITKELLGRALDISR